MSERNIIDALIVTDKNIRQLSESIVNQLSDDIVIMRILMRAAEDYNDQKGSGAFQSLGNQEKIMFICRYATQTAYIEALIDIRATQLEALEAISIDY